jgi:hypothetical protein
MNALSMVRSTNAGAGAGLRRALFWANEVRRVVRAGTPMGESK